MSADRHPSREPRASIDLIAYALVVLVAVIAPAFKDDDAVFFNYLHNVSGARPLYYYTGYVHFIPELVTYLLSPLPLLMQVLLYRVVPLAVALLLYRQLKRLFAVHASATEAGLLALASILILRVVDVDMWANISHVAWTVLLAATVVVMRTNLAGDRYSLPSAIGVGIAGLSFPVGGLLAGLFAFHAVTGGRGLRRTQNAVLAVIVTAGHVVASWFSPDQVWNRHLANAPWLFITGFRESKFTSLIVVISVTLLAAALWWAWRQSQRSRELVVIGSLCFVGWGSIALYVLSSRFERYDGGFQTRYVIPVLFCALAAVVWAIVAGREGPARLQRIGGFVGLAAAFAVIFFYSTLRGPLEVSLMKYRFIMVAAAAREHCRPGDLFVFEDDAASPVLLCEPVRLPPGDFILTDFVPTLGANNPDAKSDAKPYLISPKPLF